MEGNSQARTVAPEGFYKRDERGLNTRQVSRVLPLRNFNNWVKSVLISEHCKPGFTVLDLCCGKGGDLHKYELARVSFYVGVDNVKESIHHAKGRYDKSSRSFEAVFLHGDVTDDSTSISSVVSEYYSLEYDLVSSQFAINYLTASEAKFRAFLGNVAENLKPGGYFVGTIPDANILVKKLRTKGKNFEFGNTYYSIKFDRDKFPRSEGAFGLEYGFYLEDCVGERKTLPEGIIYEYIPEYLVLPDVFASIALEYGLRPEYRRNFHDFYVEKVANPHHQRLFEKMMGREIDNLNQELWDVAYLYDVIVLRKEGEFVPPVRVQHDSKCNALVLSLKPDTTID